MAKPHRARDPFVHQSSWSPRQPDDLDQERQLLLDEARAGSREAQAALLTSYLPMMNVYFGRLLSPKLAAKESELDLVQKAALLAWRGFEKFVGCELAGYHAWLMRICGRVLADLLRHYQPGGKRDLACEQALDEQALDAGGQRAFGRRQRSPEEIAAALESLGELQAAVQELPDDERKLFVWHCHDGQTFAQIASRLNLSIDSVKRSFKRIVARVKRRPAMSDE